jgi:hypothetical protein
MRMAARNDCANSPCNWAVQVTAVWEAVLLQETIMWIGRIA